MDDDADSFALVVEFEENSVPRLKNKLVKYFQSKRRSGGGECQIEYEDRSGTALLRFRREEDRARVVAQQSHEMDLDEGRLRLTVRLPGSGPRRTQLTTNNQQSNLDGRAAEESQVEAVRGEEQTEESGEEPTEEPASGSTSAVLENVPQDMNEEFMEMLVPNICKNKMTTQPEFSLEMLPDTCSAVVTFSTAKENNEFITSCQTNRIFLSKKLSVRALEVTSQVRVEDVSNIREDVLLLYFENEGWEVELVTPDQEEQSAVITFKMHAAVQSVIKKIHCIGKERVQVFPFYDSLGTALYGKDRPAPKLPPAFSKSIEPTLLKYFHQKQEAAQMVCSHLSALFCQVDLLPSSVRFSPLPALLEQKGVKAKDIRQWRHSVEQAFTQVSSRFRTLRLQPSASAWEKCEAQTREMVLDKAVKVIADEAEGTVSVVGLVDDVTRLEPTLNDLLSSIEKRVLREKSSIRREFEISKVILNLLYQEGMADQLKGTYPELEISFQDKMIFNGFQHEVDEAVNLVVNRVLAVKRQRLELDIPLFQFLKDEDAEEVTKNVFTSNGIQAAVEIDATSLCIIAVSDNILKKGEDQMKQVLTSKYIDTDDNYVLKNPEWQNLVKCLEESNNTTSKKIVITTSRNHQFEGITVVGYKDSVLPAFKEIEEFLHKYSQVTETHRVKSGTIVRYIATQDNTWFEKVKDKVDISFEKEAVNFRGPREEVMKCKSILVSMIAKVCFEEYQVSQPGAKEFFQENQDMYVSTLKKETGCSVQLVEESASGQNDLSVSVPDKPKLFKKSFSKPPGTDVELRIQLGNIQDARTQVVVNVVGEQLDLDSGAVSKAILSAAGPKLQILVNEQRKTGDMGEVIMTDGCNLKSSLVFHAVVPAWDKRGNALKIMRGIVAKCLNMAENQGLTSISFPAIGTGNLGFPKDLAASVMMEEVSKFNKQSQFLKEVVIVLYPKDQETIQVFTDTFKKPLPTTANVPAPSQSKSSIFSKVTSASGLHEMTIGHVSVQVESGDITQETTDVIVNSSNDSFSLKSGVSKAILDAAGPTVENECKILGGQPNTGMILTTPGNLRCQKILHLPGRNNPQEIQDTVKDALVLVEQNQYTSVSFPALGTGQGNAQAGRVADAMLGAVEDVVTQAAPGCLKVVRIIIFQQAMLKDFHSRMEKKAGHNTSFLGKLKGGLEGISAFFSGGGSDSKQQKHNVYVPLKDRKIEPTRFHICGSSQAEVDKAKTWIKDLISKEHIKSSFNDRTILSLSDADTQRIVDIQSTMNVRVQIERNSACINIEGLSKNVLKANTEIREMLKKVRDEEEIKKILETVEWQYQLQGLHFQDFDDHSKFLLEQAHHNQQPHVSVDIQGRVHNVDMTDKTATDKQGNNIAIKRYDCLKDQDVIKVPKHWEPMPSGTSCHSFTVPPNTPEYNEVEQLFKATVPRNIIKIERIQNTVLCKSLQLKKADMEAKNGHPNNERRLFHGACYTSVPAINQNGFNRSYAGKNAANYGNGTYFAVNANYSAHNTYSKPNAQGQKCVYLCRVLTGDYTNGTQGMVVPPTKPASTLLYDSVVDNVNAIQMFVIFHDTHACPEYLITFM